MPAKPTHATPPTSRESPALDRASPRLAHASPRLDRDRQAAPQVYERLRDLIVTLALPPGSPLSRANLADQFGVSSTPIRDALMRLDKEGLVDVFPQYATVVSKIDVERAEIAHFLRQSVELEVVRALALSPDAALAARLAGIIKTQQALAKADDLAGFMAADAEFHHSLYQAAGKQDLWDLIRSRSGHIDRLRRLHLPSRGKAQAIVRDHKAIASAIAAGEPDVAQKQLRAHLSGTLRDLDKIRANHPEYLSKATR